MTITETQIQERKNDYPELRGYVMVKKTGMVGKINSKYGSPYGPTWGIAYGGEYETSEIVVITEGEFKSAPDSKKFSR